MFLTRHVRERNELPLERTIQELTCRQADTFGSCDRGISEPERAADLCSTFVVSADHDFFGSLFPRHVTQM